MQTNMDFKDLVGKTITSSKQMRKVRCDDDGYLELTFSDGSAATIIASYGEYTGNSDGEYPTQISIQSGKLIEPSKPYLEDIE